MDGLINHAITALGLWSVFILSAVGPYIFPAAGELAIFVAAASHGTSLPLIIVMGTAGGAIGDHAAYWFGRRAGTALTRKRFTPEKRQRLEKRVHDHAPLWLVAGRMVTGLRTWLAIFAGVGRLDYRRFTILNLVGCIIWAVVFTAIGWIFGKNFDINSLLSALGHYGLLIAFGVIAMYAAMFALRRSRAKPPAKEEG